MKKKHSKDYRYNSAGHPKILGMLQSIHVPENTEFKNIMLYNNSRQE